MGRRGAGRLRLLAAAVLAGHLTFAGQATACAFHTVKPEMTAIDWLIASDHVVVARADPENPFAYKVTETLAGGGLKATIPDLVDSHTRHALAIHPADGVLFTHDAATMTWRRVAYLSPAYRAVVDRVLAEKDGWEQPYDQARFEIFEALQDHPSRDLRELALREIDKAPYEVLRAIKLKIPVADLLADLDDTREYLYQPIRALLLGLSGDAAASERLRAQVDLVSDPDRTTYHLGAFATGLIEIDGTEGIALLEQKVLADPRQPLDKLEQVVEALAIHNGAGSNEVKAAINEALGQMVTARPETAPLIARQFGGREDWSQAARLAPLIEGRMLHKAVDLLPVAVYVAQAKGAGAFAASPAQGG